MFINIPLSTIPPVGFAIVDVVDPTVDVVDLSANINKNIINFNKCYLYDILLRY